jgi:tetratricopeptide (TPR) repeat protein
MNNFDLKSARLVSIIIFLCLIFTLVIWNAFKYLPSEDAQNRYPRHELNLPDDNENVKQNEENNEENQEEENNEEGKNIRHSIKVSQEDLPDLSFGENNQSEEKNLEEVPSREIISDEHNKTQSLEDIEKNAMEHKANKQFEAAIIDFKKAISLAPNNSSKAKYYEEIADIYAIAKRYGSALSYAQKAYNLSPTTQREVLLARLYYKTGDIDKATQRVNNVLRRDFNLEN